MVLSHVLTDTLFVKCYFSLDLGFPANSKPVKHAVLLLDYLRW